MSRSVVAIVLPSFRVALVRERSPELGPREPLAVVVHETHDDRRISGGTRLDEVSAEARVHGVLPGDTVASAKSKLAELRIRVLRPREATRALESLAEMLLAFGAITSPLLSRDAVVVDVTGCAHLHGGEAALLAAITSAVASLGFSCRAALAPGPEMAWALAWAGRTGVFGESEVMRVLGELPVDVLRLDPRTTSYLHRLGVSTLEALRALPRSTLAARTNDETLLARVRALLDGTDDTPITRHVPEQVIEERVDLEWGIEQHEALFFVLKTLCDRLAARLQGRCALVSRALVVLELDRALCPKGAPTQSRVPLPLAAPLGKSEDLLVALRARFESEPPLVAPVLGVVLQAPELAPPHPRTRPMFEPESRAELALPKLITELEALMGEGTVGVLAVADDWRIEHRSLLVRISERRPHVAPSCAPEPVRLLDCEPNSGLEELEHVARYRYLVWWRAPSSTVDWSLAWTGDAMAFVETGRIRGFLD